MNKYHPPPKKPSIFESPTKYCRKKNVLTVVTEMVDVKKYRDRRWLFIPLIVLQRACLRCPIKFEAKKQPQGRTAGGMGEQINTEWETNPGLNLWASGTITTAGTRRPVPEIKMLAGLTAPHLPKVMKWKRKQKILLINSERKDVSIKRAHRFWKELKTQGSRLKPRGISSLPICVTPWDLERSGVSASHIHPQPTPSFWKLLRDPESSLGLCFISESLTLTALSRSAHAAPRAFPAPVMFSMCFLDSTKVTASGQNSTPAESRCDGITLAKRPVDQPSCETDPKQTSKSMTVWTPCCFFNPQERVTSASSRNTVLLSDIAFCKGAKSYDTEGWLWTQSPWTQSLPTCASLGQWRAGPRHCRCRPASRPHHRRWWPGGLWALGDLHRDAWQCFVVAGLAVLLLPGLCHIFRLQIRLTRSVSAGYGQIWACTLEIREDRLTRMARCSLGRKKMIARLGEHLGKALLRGASWCSGRPRGMHTGRGRPWSWLCKCRALCWMVCFSGSQAFHPSSEGVDPGDL